jgi:hypothetical protein
LVGLPVPPWTTLLTVSGQGQQRRGQPPAQRLLSDGEHIADVPAKASARAQLFDTGQNHEIDAHVVAAGAVGTRLLGCFPDPGAPSRLGFSPDIVGNTHRRLAAEHLAVWW